MIEINSKVNKSLKLLITGIWFTLLYKIPELYILPVTHIMKPNEYLLDIYILHLFEKVL